MEEFWTLSRISKKLLADLAVLDIEKEKAIDLAAFEKLTNEKDLYSIHRPNSRKNVRIIYTIIDRKIIILLTVFLEKNKSDYQNAISVAKIDSNSFKNNV